ncbi:MAG: aminomethyltransferase family protein [Phycisphaeraceae bacterium]
MGASLITYGPSDEGAVELAEDFGHFEAEYATIRQRVGIMVLPQRAVLSLTGSDRQDFLHRMLTQDINRLTGGSTVRAFQLNTKGRIVADVLVHHGDDSSWLEMDRFDLPQVLQMYDSHLFADDVTLADWTDQRLALALHGPLSLELLRSVSEQDPTPMAKMPGTHHVLTVCGSPVTVYRRDTCGVPGFGLWVRAEDAERVYMGLLEAAGYEAEVPDPATDPQAAADYARRRREGLRGRPIGWAAFNTARIEAGTPIFHIDFGHDSLPAETGVLDEAVSFTKGCYLGQEIVARMHSLGHPKRLLVGLKVEGDGLPVAGAQVLEAGGDGCDASTSQNVIGGVTSSAVSPLLGRPVVFAVMKWGAHTPGTEVVVSTESGLTRAKVQGLGFLEGSEAG